MRRFIEQLDAVAWWVNRAAAVLSAVLLVYLFSHIIFEIILRRFAMSTFVLDEFVGYTVAAMTFLSLAYTLDTGGLIRVDLVVGNARGRLRRWIELFCIGSTFAVSVFVVYWIGRDLLRNINRGAVSESIAEVPLWLPLSAVWVGVLLFSFQLFVYFLRVAAGGPVVRGPEEAGLARAEAEAKAAQDGASQASTAGER